MLCSPGLLGREHLCPCGNGTGDNTPMEVYSWDKIENVTTLKRKHPETLGKSSKIWCFNIGESSFLSFSSETCLITRGYVCVFLTWDFFFWLSKALQFTFVKHVNPWWIHRHFQLIHRWSPEFDSHSNLVWGASQFNQLAFSTPGLTSGQKCHDGSFTSLCSWSQWFCALFFTGKTVMCWWRAFNMLLMFLEYGKLW